MTLVVAACDKQEYVAEPTAKSGQPARVTHFGEFGSWDVDSDGQLTKSEFEARLTEEPLFNDFDGDGDGELTDLEFQAGLYNAWDTNGDEKVDVWEYRYGTGAWFADRTMYGRFEDWDADGDEELTLSEFNERGDPVMEGWDLDGDDELTDLEFQSALWNAWDLDGDEVVDIYEYRGTS